MMIDAYLLPLAIALLALATQALDWRGVAAATAIAYFIVLWQDVNWLLILLVLFTLGTTATRIKSNYKEKRGLGQRVRSTENVLANGVVAVVMVFLGSFYGFIGAVSTATADTLSSELGVLSRRRPWLLTTFKKVNTGTNGGVSALGTAFAVFGAAMVGLVAWWGTGSYIAFVVALVIGVTGCFVDSLVGATIENRGIIGNWQTNLIATSFGGLVGYAIPYLF
jgi:uncharacterized protein (TIGR00297 family)